MKCFECKKREAEWVLQLDERFVPICQECLDEYCHMEGEVNLKFWLLTNLETTFTEINKWLEYRDKKYLLLLYEWSQLKKVNQLVGTIQ